MALSISRICYTISLVFLATILAPGSAFSADKEELSKKKAELQQMYMTYLADNGYRPKLDSDGDVVFRHEGGNYIIQVHEDDRGYFRLLFPNFWEIESEEERQDVLFASSISNSSIKCSKIFIVRDNVWGVVEHFLVEPLDYEKLLSRSISALQDGVSTFKLKMQELKEKRKKEGK